MKRQTYCHHTQTDAEQLIRREVDRLRVSEHAPLYARGICICRDLLLEPLQEDIVVGDSALSNLCGVGCGFCQLES